MIHNNMNETIPLQLLVTLMLIEQTLLPSFSTTICHAEKVRLGSDKSNQLFVMFCQTSSNTSHDVSHFILLDCKITMHQILIKTIIFNILNIHIQRLCFIASSHANAFFNQPHKNALIPVHRSPAISLHGCYLDNRVVWKALFLSMGMYTFYIHKPTRLSIHGWSPSYPSFTTSNAHTFYEKKIHNEIEAPNRISSETP